MSRTHQLDLLNNSISYFREAVSYAQQDPIETNHWKFAIVHVVQAMELAFKERLRRIHPLFIYESVDKAERTLSLKGALGRLRNARIGNVPISDSDSRKIEKAFDLRNELTHFEFNHPQEQIELKFAEIFSFMIFFYRSELGLDTTDFVAEEQHRKIIQLVRTRDELMKRAIAYISEHADQAVWSCPSCGEDTFIVPQAQCCFCHHREELVECPTCGLETLESDLIDISDLFEWAHDEGQAHLIDDFGLEKSACPECISATKEKAEDRRRARHHEYMEMEYYAQMRGH